MQKISWKIQLTSAVPDLVSLHDTLFMALQASSQTFFVKTNSLLILHMKPDNISKQDKRFTLQKWQI